MADGTHNTHPERTNGGEEKAGQRGGKANLRVTGGKVQGEENKRRTGGRKELGALALRNGPKLKSF